MYKKNKFLFVAACFFIVNALVNISIFIFSLLLVDIPIWISIVSYIATFGSRLFILAIIVKISKSKYVEKEFVLDFEKID
jgi:hypothetical protein